MAIPPSGTFQYAGVVPEIEIRSSGRWQLHDESGAESSTGDDDLIRNRLVGLHPSLQVEEVGLTPDVRVSPYTGTVRPKVLRSRLTLQADGEDRASVAKFSFCVDRALARSWQVGDVLHVVRTGCGGLALSVIRDERLIAAIGAVTAVRHDGLTIRPPSDAIHEARRVFGRLDPSFEFSELPVEVRVGSEALVRYRSHANLGDYSVFVEHGFYPGIPGVDECLAVSLVGSSPETAAICSALLLEYSDLQELVQW